jgi:hypothetical protein
MKTPRDWLLDRHRMEVPELNALRRAALPSPSSWQNLFGPHRRAWRLLAAVWVTLALFHFTIGRPPRSAKASSPSPAMLAAWMTQFGFHDSILQIDRLP